MRRIIPNLRALGNRRDAVLPLLIVLVGLASFGLGRLSAFDEARGGLRLDAAPELLPANDGNVKHSQGAVVGQAAQAQGQFVASRSGVAYHYPWCSGAKRISDENKIYFESRREAEQAGYRAAKNCPGL